MTAISTTTGVEFRVNGVALRLALDPRESDSDSGGWHNGTVTLPDGRTIGVGGGWIHSAESAARADRCSGLQTDTHPELPWPGASEAGDFDPYDGYENGDLDGLAAAVGLDIDRETEAGDDAWRGLVRDVQAASGAAYAAQYGD